MPRKYTDEERLDRFWARVSKSENCWLWTGAVNARGYGSLSNGVRVVGAHVYSYEIYYGPVPAGMCVCHHCDNPPCVRPDHLFLGTYTENALDCSRKGRANGSARAHHGEDHGRAKLTWEQVCEIRRRHPKPPGRGIRSSESMLKTAAEFGINSGHISAIVAGRSWQRPRGEKGR